MLTIKDKLFGFVKPFFSNQLAMHATNEIIKIQQILDREREDRRQLSEVMELDAFVGKPVICISNEWETPSIGIATRIDFITKAQNPVLCVRNYLDGQEYIVLGKVFHFTAQRFNAFFKLDPFELQSFIYSYSDGEIDKDRSNQLLTKEEVVQLLVANDFFDHAGISIPV